MNLSSLVPRLFLNGLDTRLEFEWIRTILSKYPSLREDYNGKSPPFLQQLCQVEHSYN